MRLTRHTGSGSEPGAAFLTAASDNIATCGGCHAGEETDPAFPATVRGLKSSFHFRFILLLKITIIVQKTLPGMTALPGIIPQLAIVE